MTRLADIARSQPAAAGVQSALVSGRLAHAYLISGSTAADRQALADAIAAAVVCEAGSGDACGHCRACTLAEGGNHPDISHWTADGATFKIAQALALQAAAWVRPLMAARKVFVVEDAGVMTTEAANALLKLLEEPPGAALFLLLAPAARVLLPTITSRVQPLTLHGDAAADIAEAEEGAWELLSRLRQLDDASIGAIAEAWDRDKAAARDKLSVLLELWRDTLALALGCPADVLYRPNWAPRLQTIVPHWTESELVAGLAAIGRAQRQLDQNANLRLCLEVLFTSLLPAM